jgi:ATP-dependent Zn protease
MDFVAHWESICPGLTHTGRCCFFLDEIDSIGAQRQQLGRNDDPGEALARAYNSIVTELLLCVDQYRGAAGFILTAATNFYEGLV